MAKTLRLLIVSVMAAALFSATALASHGYYIARVCYPGTCTSGELLEAVSSKWEFGLPVYYTDIDRTATNAKFYENGTLYAEVSGGVSSSVRTRVSDCRPEPQSHTVQGTHGFIHVNSADWYFYYTNVTDRCLSWQ